MGNAMGKKRKLGSAQSAKWVAPESAKKDGLSPLARSYSMPVHHAKPKSDNYHVVALTSSTYGILKVDVPKEVDESRISMSQTKSTGEPRGAHSPGFQEKVKKFEIPEIVVPKPWSDDMFSNYKKSVKETEKVKKGSESLMSVNEEEPEIINTWEMMEGLDDDFRSPSPLVLPPMLISPQPVVMHKKVRSLDTSLSFSSIHSITEVDVDYLEDAVKSELRSAFESDTLVKGKCYNPKSPPHGFGAPVSTFSRPNGGNLSARHGFGKENAASSPPVQRETVFSTLTPVKLNSSSNVISSVTTTDTKANSLKSSGSLLRTPTKAAANTHQMDATPFTTPVKGLIEHPLPKDSVNSDFNFSKLNIATISGSGVRTDGSPTVSPKGLFGKNSSPPTGSQQEQVGSENKEESPFSFATTVFSTSDDSEGQVPAESPLFDPELLASFEVSEDEWYRVRRSDAGVASTSGSSSEDGDRSPLRKASQNSSSSDGSSTTVRETSPLARNSETEAAISRKMSFSKVAPVDFRDVILQKVRKADPFDSFEKMCPAGGEDRVVIYVTSLRGIRKTFEECSHMKLVILGYRVAVDERDVSMHAEFRQEMKDLLGMPKPVPRLFIKGHYIGGAEEVSLLHEDGTLAKLLDTMPTQTSWEQCDGCGDHRFVPCSTCSGSCKLVTEDNEVVRCTDCNENGLVRCPMCF